MLLLTTLAEYQNAMSDYNNAVTKAIESQQHYCAMLEVFNETLNQKTEVVSPKEAYFRLLKNAQKR